MKKREFKFIKDVDEEKVFLQKFISIISVLFIEKDVELEKLRNEVIVFRGENVFVKFLYLVVQILEFDKVKFEFKVKNLEF